MGVDIYNSPAHQPNLSLLQLILSESQCRTLRFSDRVTSTTSPTQFAMESEFSNCGGAATLAGGASIQAELLVLLEKVVQLMASSVMKNLPDLPDVCERILN